MNNITLAIGACACLLIACASEGNRPSSNPVSGRGLRSKVTGGNAMTSEVLMYRMVRRMPGEDFVDARIDVHLWHPDSSHAVSGGVVSVDGTAIEPYVMVGATGYMVQTPHQTVPLRFDGSYHHFTVAGAEGFPPLVDSIRAPVGETVVTYPAPGDTVSRSAGFTITWAPVDDVDGVYLSISDTSRAIGSKAIFREIAGNTGHYDVTPEELATMKPGRLDITLGRGNVHVGQVENRPYRLVFGSGQDLDVRLVP